MTIEFKFPDVGEGITEGELVKWRVKEGDAVEEHQILAEVETDKAIVEIPSPAKGKILKLHHKEGDTVKVGEVLVTIGGEGEKIKMAEEVKKPEIKPAGVVGYLEEAPEEKAEEVLAAPATRRLAKELGVDITKIKGTGLEGRITEEDVRNAAGKKEVVTVLKTKREYDLYGYIEKIPLKGIRKSTAKKMRESISHAAHVTHMDEADITELAELREKEKPLAQEKNIHLTFLPFIVKAVVHSLKEYPYLNATLDEEHEEIILKKYYNIGIAVDTPEGLLVPVIKEAQDKSILEISQEIEKLAIGARDRTIDLADLKGGTFTITNVGSEGGVFATPIINYPEVAILALGRIHDKLVVDEKGKIKIRKVLPMSLSFDHRVLDGAEAARFTNFVKKHLENPGLLLIERD